MKQTLKITFMAIMMTIAIGCRAQHTFPSLSGQKDISIVYISGAMMKSFDANIPSEAEDAMEGMNIEKINSLEIINCEDKTTVQLGEKAMNEFIAANPNAELLMQTIEDDEQTMIYNVPDPTLKNKTKIIIYNKEPDEVTIVVINGEASKKD